MLLSSLCYTDDMDMERIRRLADLKEESFAIYRASLDKYFVNHRIAAVVIMWSGGNDSNTLAHMMRSILTHAGHANTGIGIEDTRAFVRETCKAWGLPLIEKRPPISYEALVLERGFPGPAQHYKMYQRLKERCFRQIRAELVGNPRKERVLFVAGRRRDESRRRAGKAGKDQIPLYERDGSIVWVSPMANWTKLDINTYRMVHPDVPHNPVSDHIHMSGECLCGSFAKPGELDSIEFFYPEVVKYIKKLEIKVAAKGIAEERCTWGWGAYRKGRIVKPSRTGRACSSCAPLVD